MIKEALDFITKLQTPKNPVTFEVHGKPYAVKPDGTLGDVVALPDLRKLAEPLKMSTLTGIVSAYRQKIGAMKARAGLWIENTTTVHLLDLDADEHGKRQIYATASHAAETKFQLEKWYDVGQEFIVAFRSSFYLNEEAVKVLQLASTVGAGEAVNVSDDGISQEVATKSGTVTKVSTVLPAEGIPLIPWRTFREVVPVVSPFLLRMRGVKDGLPQIALFPIDAKWRIETMSSIRSWLQAELPNADILA